jgi:DNA-binding protein H-NS
MAANSLEEILAQIEKLKKELDARRPEVIADMKKRIQELDIQSSELFDNLPRLSDRTVERKLGKAPKYRDPQSNLTWTGQGKPPKWMAGADGKIDPAKKEKFAIK